MRIIDAFVDSVDLDSMGFKKAETAQTVAGAGDARANLRHVKAIAE